MDCLLKDCNSKIRWKPTALPFQNLVLVFAVADHVKKISSPKSTRRRRNSKEKCAVVEDRRVPWCRTRARVLRERSSTVLYIASLPFARFKRGLFRFAPHRGTSNSGITVTFEPGGMCRGTPRGGIERRSLEARQEDDRGRVARGRSQSANYDEIDSLLARYSMSIWCCARATNVSGVEGGRCYGYGWRMLVLL